MWRCCSVQEIATSPTCLYFSRSLKSKKSTDNYWLYFNSQGGNQSAAGSERRHPHASPFLRAEWAVLHSTAPIIHQAAEKTIHIHQFSPRELWSRWYTRLYGSDHISHSGLINAWTQSQMLLDGLHMFQLPPRWQKGTIIASNVVKNICVCTCFTHLCLGHLQFKYLF